MPNAIDLTTVETAGTLPGVSASSPHLARLITAASQLIARHVGYELHRRTGVTESVPGQGGRYLFLKAGAIQAITSIAIGGAAVDPADYALDSALMGRIVRKSSSPWPFTGTETGGVDSTALSPVNDGSIVVTFTAGYVTPGQKAVDAVAYPETTLPADLEQACLELVTTMYRRLGQDQDVQSISLGGGSVSFGEKSAMPATVRALLASHRKLTRRVF